MDNIDVCKKQSLMHAIYERYKEVNDCFESSMSMSLMITGSASSAGRSQHEASGSSSSSATASPISDDGNSNSNSSSPVDIATDSCISFYIPPAYSPRKSQSGFVVASCSLVMSDQFITHIGDSEELERSCQNVLELDLAKNHLCHWNEVKKLLMSLKRLRLLNLSQNPLLSSLDSVSTVPQLDDTIEASEANLYERYFSNEWSSVPRELTASCFDNLRILILNSCFADLKLVQCLLEQFTHLNELHLASNNYAEVTFDEHFSKPSLKILYFNNNDLSSWHDVCKLGRCFPNLENLVISHNNFSTFSNTPSTGATENGDEAMPSHEEQEAADDDLCTSKCFRNLQILILNRLKINEWSVIDQLRDFPLLRHVRIQNIPLLDRYNEEEKYYMLVAHLDESIVSLNGSEITSDERETCERKYIRHYMDAAEKPKRYYELERKHGKLDPLANVNLDVGKRVHVKLKFKEKNVYERVDVRQTVGEFKKYLEKFTGYPASRLRVFYIDIEAMSVFGPEEMKHANRCLHSFNIRDGDEFEIDLKAPPQIVHVSQSDSSFQHVLHTSNNENIFNDNNNKAHSPRAAHALSTAAAATRGKVCDQQNHIRCSGNNTNHHNEYHNCLNRCSSTKKTSKDAVSTSAAEPPKPEESAGQVTAAAAAAPSSPN